MKDIEIKVFNILSTSIKNQFGNDIYVVGEYTPTPTKFPCVMIEQNDNYAKIVDGANREVYSSVMYQVDVFSNKKSGRKTQAKTIIECVDNVLTRMGFTREMMSPTPNEDRTIYRITARYTADVHDEMIFRG